MCEWPSTSPGSSVALRQVDHLRVGGVDRRSGSGRFDAVAAHPDRPALVAGLAIEDAGGFQDSGILRRSGKGQKEESEQSAHRGIIRQL